MVNSQSSVTLTADTLVLIRAGDITDHVARRQFDSLLHVLDGFGHALELERALAEVVVHFHHARIDLARCTAVRSTRSLNGESSRNTAGVYLS